jgi:YidC/Oxa1 family membrane protein insertase
VFDLLASPVGSLLAAIHSGLVALGLDSASGWAWGLSIVLLTVTVRLILFPLFVKQIKSQRRMQELAPKIKELQKQHKGDRETLNVEMMKLYKENNANPISGCLPLLLQLPVFFALFTVIRNFKTSAEASYGLTTQQLREGAEAQVFGAPISAAFNSPASLLNELGAEALTVRVVAFLMVIGMGASTFWTQRQLMARSGTTDPQQVMVQKLLLYVLPLSFAVSGVFFPIGVLLYWLTTNVWSMGQQAWVIKRMPPVNLTPGKPGPAAESKGSKDKGPKDTGPKDKGKGPTGGGKRGQDLSGPDKGSDGGTEQDGGTTPGSGPAAGTSAVPRSIGGRSPAATPKAAVSAPANRRPSGARKNKNRRGGRR